MGRLCLRGRRSGGSAALDARGPAHRGREWSRRSEGGRARRDERAGRPGSRTRGRRADPPDPRRMGGPAHQVLRGARRCPARSPPTSLTVGGAWDELFGLVGQLKRLGVPIIALTGDPDSVIARQCDVALDASVAEEACAETLAPTTSTTAALALGDALAVTLLEVKGFRREDF